MRILPALFRLSNHQFLQRDKAGQAVVPAFIMFVSLFCALISVANADATSQARIACVHVVGGLGITVHDGDSNHLLHGEVGHAAVLRLGEVGGTEHGHVRSEVAGAHAGMRRFVSYFPVRPKLSRRHGHVTLGVST